MLLTLGLATPLAAASLASVMLTALRTAALALAEGGSGPWSLDRLLRSERRGVGWAAAALAAAAAGSAGAIAVGRRQPTPTVEDGEQPESSGDETAS